MYIATGLGAHALIEIVIYHYTQIARDLDTLPSIVVPIGSTSISGVIRKGALTDLEIERGAYI